MSGRDSRSGRGQDPPSASLPLGTVGGIQVRVNWSVAVIFALIAFGLAAWQFPAVNPRLTVCADRRALVFSNGHLAGIITPSDITRMIDRLGFRRSP